MNRRKLVTIRNWTGNKYIIYNRLRTVKVWKRWKWHNIYVKNKIFQGNEWTSKRNKAEELNICKPIHKLISEMATEC